MDDVTLAQAQVLLSELVSRAEAGETIEITCQGKPVARVVPDPVPPPRKPFDWEALRAFTRTLPFQSESSADIVRRMRDEERY